MKISNFEDLKVWQLSRELTKDIYSFTRNEKVKVDKSICNQIQRAAISVMNNIAEGYERHTRKEFIHFLYISRGSVGEVRSMLYACKDLQFITDESFSKLKANCTQLSKSLYRFIDYLEKTKHIYK